MKIFSNLIGISAGHPGGISHDTFEGSLRRISEGRIRLNFDEVSEDIF